MQKRIRVNGEYVLSIDDFIRTVKLAREAFMHRGGEATLSDEHKKAFALIEGIDYGSVFMGLTEELMEIIRGRVMIDMKKSELPRGKSFKVYHKKSGETWYGIGVDPNRELICIAGYPPSMAHMEDCVFLGEIKPLDPAEIAYRDREFGGGWV